MLLLIPRHRFLRSLLQIVLRMIAQLVDSRLYITTPVALFQYVIFIVVQGRDMSSQTTMRVMSRNTHNGATTLRHQGRPKYCRMRLLKSAD